MCQNHCNNHHKNTVMQNALNCQITSTKKMNMKKCKTFPNFSKTFWKKFLWTLDFGKLKGIIFNMAKIHKLLVKKEISDVLSSRIVLDDWKTIYIFRLQCKKGATLWKIFWNKLYNLASIIIIITKKTDKNIHLKYTIFIKYWKC